MKTYRRYTLHLPIVAALSLVALIAIPLSTGAQSCMGSSCGGYYTPSYYGQPYSQAYPRAYPQPYQSYGYPQNNSNYNSGSYYSYVQPFEWHASGNIPWYINQQGYNYNQGNSYGGYGGQNYYPPTVYPQSYSYPQSYNYANQYGNSPIVFQPTFNWHASGNIPWYVTGY